jgi:hypothetical protein
VPPRGGTGDSSTVARTGSETGRALDPGFMNPGSVLGSRPATAERRAPGDVRGRGIEPRARACARHRTRDRRWREVWRAASPGEHRPGRLRLPRRGSNGTDPRGEQSFEAGVPFVDGEPGVHGEWTARAAHLRVRRGDRTSDREEPSSRLTSRRGGESDREAPGDAAPDEGRRANPHGSNDPRERARAPRGGKALEGQHRDANRLKYGGEASSAAGEGPGRSSSHQTGARRRRIRGKNLTRDGPGRDNRSGGDEARGLWRGPNPTREDRATQHRATRVRRGKPRGRKDDEGGAPKPIGRYSTGTARP